MESESLKNFFTAEDYHQDYLKKNPNGYCHIDLSKADEIIVDKNRYSKLTEQELREKLTTEQYNITQNANTEMSFSNEYWNFLKMEYMLILQQGNLYFLQRINIIQCVAGQVLLSR